MADPAGEEQSQLHDVAMTLQNVATAVARIQKHHLEGVLPFLAQVSQSVDKLTVRVDALESGSHRSSALSSVIGTALALSAAVPAAAEATETTEPTHQPRASSNEAQPAAADSATHTGVSPAPLSAGVVAALVGEPSAPSASGISAGQLPDLVAFLGQLSQAIDRLRVDCDALRVRVDSIAARPTAEPAHGNNDVGRTAIVKLNVGGVFYSTSRTTLTKNPDSMLGAMFSGRYPLPLDDDGRAFIDRDGDSFAAILSFLRTDRWVLPPEPHVVERIRLEAQYFGLPWPQSELDVSTVRCEAQLLGHQGKIAALLQWNDILVSADSDSTVRLWTPDRSCVAVIDIGEPFAVGLWQSDLVTITDTLVRVWDAKGACVRAVVIAGDEGVAMVARSWRGERFVCGFFACCDVRVWNSRADFEDSCLLRGHRSEVSSLTEWGGNLVSADEREVRVWGWDCQCVHVIRPLGQAIACLAVHTDRLFVGQASVITVYDAAFNLELTLRTDDTPLSALIPWQGFLASYAAAAGVIEVWDVEQFWEADTARPETVVAVQPVSRLTTSKASSGVLAVWNQKLVSSDDRHIKLWDGKYS